MPQRTGAPRIGRVVAFDGARGLGEVEGSDGRRWPFHCTAVADGSRTVAVGAAVAFTVVPGHGGTDQAAGLVVLGPAGEAIVSR